MRSDVVVIGGGIAGLVAALRLDQAGAKTTVIEGSGRLGGIVSTRRDDGYVVEEGPDGFVAGKGSVLRLAAELGLEDEVIWNRAEAGGAFVWWGTELHPLPTGLLLMVPYRLGPLFRSSLLSWRGKARVLGDLVIPRSAAEDDVSLESFVSRRLGGEMLERIAQPLVAGIHGADPATMSLEASFPRFLEMERNRRSLILAARAAYRSADEHKGPSHFASFRRGMGQLVEAVVGAFSRVELRTGVPARSIEPVAEGGYVVSLGDGSEIRAGAVVLAVPAPVAGDLLGALAPDAAGELSEIGQVPHAAVTFAYRTDQLPPLSGSGFLVPAAQQRKISGVSYSSKKWQDRVPDEASTLVRVFLSARPDTGSSIDPDTLEAMATEELAEMIGITARPIRAWASTRADGLHRYTLGHVGRVERAESALSRWSGVVLAGAGFHGIGLNECLDSAERAADNVLVAIGSSPPARSGAGH